MAYAENATREVVTTKTEDVIRLDLSKEEAQTLAVILSRVGGNPYGSPRRDAENIFDALTDLIGDYRGLPQDRLVDDRFGPAGISFRSAEAK